jgi:hypothetical protein
MFFTSRNKRLEANVRRLEELEKNIIRLNIENQEHLNVIRDREIALQKIISEKSLGFPWLATAISEFYKYQDDEIANYLENKKHPALKKADALREVASINKQLRKQLKVARNFVLYYESLFPWITDYVGEGLDQLIQEITLLGDGLENKGTDPVLKFITKSEYRSLSTIEKNQKALNRYLESRKTSHELGRDYERFIGYLYESQGYRVQYVGIENGKEDLGRDLICFKKQTVEIIQCKYWAKHKTIHEKHINQLYGTIVKYYIDANKEATISRDEILLPEIVYARDIRGTFVTSTSLSPTARTFANALGIEVIQDRPLEKYPIIKCNIGTRGQRIYHLPFDQQYDKTQIKNEGEFYASSIEEAESRGFRRAFKWTGQ